jgi:hypothetical protein
MSCRKAQDVDLSGFLAEPRGPAFAAFREHYPACVECAAEVRAWTELHLQLRGPEAHPAPHLLLSYQDEPAALAPERRSALAGHLESCASCRDELAALGAFDPAAAAAPARAARGEGPLEWLGAALRRALWQPALAYALLLLLLVPLVLQRWGEVSEPEPLSPDAPSLAFETAKRSEQLRRDQPAPDPKESAPGRRGAASAPMAPESRGKTKADPAGAPAENLPETIAMESAVVLEEAESDSLAAADEFRAADRSLRAPEPKATEGGRLVDADRQANELLRREAQAKLEATRELSQTVMKRARVKSQLVAGEAGLLAEPPTLGWAREAGAIAIEIPHPPLRDGERELEVRILHADGRRQLVERIEVDPALPTTTIRVPLAWLGPAPATHSVEVTVPSDPPNARRTFTHSLATW